MHLYVVMSNPVEGREDEYNEYYANAHIPEITALDGFIGARRYRVSDLRPGQAGIEGYRYLCFYELEDAAPTAAIARLGAARAAGLLTSTGSICRDPGPRAVLLEEVSQNQR